MDAHLQQNRRHWDELVPIHVRSDFYNVAAFREGACSLLPLEREEVGDVAGKSLLHLQCHFGMDTLSWARRGAIVTGIDFSPQAITAARQLAQEVDLSARFIECDLYAAPQHLAEQFDLVFTSWGVLCWLPDIPRWAEVAASLVRPGGFFYLAEVHPTALVFEAEEGQRPALTYPYFGGRMTYEAPSTYADACAKVEHATTHQWTYGLGEVMTSLTDAGLRLEYLREHDFTCFRHFPGLRRGTDGLWRAPGDWPALPLSFSLKAVKPD